MIVNRIEKIINEIPKIMPKLRGPLIEIAKSSGINPTMSINEKYEIRINKVKANPTRS
tara:strand:- start:668 stop:841 length:174 start_codon:yes stop_codon:yes gene_type:complete